MIKGNTNETAIGPLAVPPESKAIAVYKFGTKNIITSEIIYPGITQYMIEKLNNVLKAGKKAE